MTTSQIAGPKPLDWIVLLVLVTIWGSSFAAIRIGVESMAPVWLVTGRMIAATLFLAAWIGAERLAGGRKNAAPAAPITARALLLYGAVGVLFTALPFTCFAIAEQSISSAAASICNGGTPVFTALLAHAFVPGERLTPRRTAGVAMGFAGLAVLVGPDLMRGEAASAAGLAIAISGAALYAGSNVMTRNAPKLSPAVSSLIIIGSGAAAMLLVSPFLAPFPAAPSLVSIGAMLFLAIMGTSLGFILWVWLIQRAGSVFTSFTTYLSPLWAAAIGVAFLGETVEWSMAAALALILAGVAIASRRPRPRVEQVN